MQSKDIRAARTRYQSGLYRMRGYRASSVQVLSDGAVMLIRRDSYGQLQQIRLSADECRQVVQVVVSQQS